MTMSVIPSEPAANWSGLIEAMLDAVWLVDPRSLAIVGAGAVGS